MKSSVKGEKKKAIRSLYYLKKDEITCISFSANEEEKIITNIEVIRLEKNND